MMEEVRMSSFFFQAEDGIRDGRVTGVQTCALPISINCATILWILLHDAALETEWLSGFLSWVNLSPARLEVREPTCRSSCSCSRRRIAVMHKLYASYGQFLLPA